MLDEPTANLDLKGRFSIWRVISKIKHKKTILLATQNIEEAEILCDRLCILKDGHSLFEGSPNQIKSKIAFDVKVDITLTQDQK
jgi:ABC-2 type transport system ATP-binding protein